MKITPGLLKFFLNLYPPYLGAGVRVEHIADDWMSMRVGMRLNVLNRNALGTHFGGSLYSMVDPHLVLMLMQLLGPGFVVWDKAARIEFRKATRARVVCDIVIFPERLEEIRSAAAGGKALPEFELEIRETGGDLVAVVHKTLYVRRKPERGHGPGPGDRKGNQG